VGAIGHHVGPGSVTRRRRGHEISSNTTGRKLVPVLDIRQVALDHPDAQGLIAGLQALYVARYGGSDDTPVDAAEFAPPRGDFLVGYLDGVPVGCAGWRARDRETDEPVLADGDAEIKRMFTLAEHRGRGFAGELLAAVEASAIAAGRRRVVLETGGRQPEAMALYAAHGYDRLAPYGTYRDYPESRYFTKPLISARSAASPR
jgi:GNAT superfamily N-acetyltransferase